MSLRLNTFKVKNNDTNLEPQVAYMIVDEAIVDLPMERDPFEAMGQPIPSELPYNDEKVRMALAQLSKGY